MYSVDGYFILIVIYWVDLNVFLIFIEDYMVSGLIIFVFKVVGISDYFRKLIVILVCYVDLDDFKYFKLFSGVIVLIVCVINIDIKGKFI